MIVGSRHLGAAQASGARARDEIDEGALDLGEALALDVVDRGRDEAALPERDRDADVNALRQTRSSSKKPFSSGTSAHRERRRP